MYIMKDRGTRSSVFLIGKKKSTVKIVGAITKPRQEKIYFASAKK